MLNGLYLVGMAFGLFVIVVGVVNIHSYMDDTAWKKEPTVSEVLVLAFCILCGFIMFGLAMAGIESIIVGLRQSVS